ncbi:unnamed protein product, partial [Vitis vinifera]
MIVGNNILRLRELHKHLCRRLEHLHLVENGGAVVGNDNLAAGGGNHLVHALGAQAGADGISHSSCRDDVGLADVIFALVVNVALGLGGAHQRSHGSRHG